MVAPAGLWPLLSPLAGKKRPPILPGGRFLLSGGRERLHLKRMGNHHPRHERRVAMHERHRIPGRLDDDRIGRF
jgi:hypothetical protein